MKGNYYGYIRVSTKEQHEDRQVIALEAFGVSRKNIYMDKWSGKDFERPKYRALMKKMRPGDVLAVKSIDRLGRIYAEIQNQWRMITKEMRADIVVLDMPLLDTRKKDKDLTGTLAKEKGVRFGRESMEIPLEFYPLQKEYKKGMIFWNGKKFLPAAGPPPARGQKISSGRDGRIIVLPGRRIPKRPRRTNGVPPPRRPRNSLPAGIQGRRSRPAPHKAAQAARQ